MITHTHIKIVPILRWESYILLLLPEKQNNIAIKDIS